MAIITISVGQSKIGAGALGETGNMVAQLPAIQTPSGLEERFDVIANQVMAVAQLVGVSRIRRVGIAYPEMMEPPSRLVPAPQQLRHTSNPYRQSIVERLSADLDLSDVDVELLHDAAAAALGEVYAMGSLPGCEECISIVWGTGVASGIIHQGVLYWHDKSIGLMTGEAGLQIVRKPNGEYIYRPTANAPDFATDEVCLDRYMRGPEVMRRIRHHWLANSGDGGEWSEMACLSGMPPELAELADINRAASLGSRVAVAAIEEAGREMGAALAPFIKYWLFERNLPFAKRVVIGSGVSKLGDGVFTKDGHHGKENVLLASLRASVGRELNRLGIDDYNLNGITLSKIGYEREFYAFL